MQRAVVTKQKMRNINVRQQNAMFNLAAVQSVVPLRKCKLSAVAAPDDALLQLSPDTGKALLQIIESLSGRRVLISAPRSYSQLD